MFSHLKRFKDNLLHINHLRKFVSAEIFFLAVGSEIKPEIIQNHLKGNILILSPHPDDDVFGCGGLIKLHSAKNKIWSVYFTDGSKGKKDNHLNHEKLVKIRRAEAEKAGKILGLNKLIFWSYEDGKITSDSKNKKALTDIINQFKPESIFVPAFTDPHPDHFETGKILSEVLAKIDYLGKIYLYEIWQPVLANRIIDIDKVIDCKKIAILAHKSQMSSRRYSDAILGLNQYRGSMFGNAKFAEAFFVCNARLYQKLFQLIFKKK